MSELDVTEGASTLDLTLRDPIPPGTTGTVTAIRQHRTWAQVDLNRDIARTAMVVVLPDRFEVLASKAKQ